MKVPKHQTMMEDVMLTQELVKQIEQLTSKFDRNGQKLADYLQGMVHANFLSYWDYIQLDTLLSLQNPKTDLKDEMIFVTYHQITELYFKLVLWEMEQLTDGSVVEAGPFLEKVTRMNRYFEQLVSSFTVMTEGLDREQFAKFRLALTPSSGFQSVQYRIIELMSTDVANLVHPNYVLWLSPEDPPQEYLDKLYWKAGARNTETGEKTLTLRQFEEKYDELLLEKLDKYRTHNLRQRMSTLLDEKEAQSSDVIVALRQFDLYANVHWPLAHFRAAVRHLVNHTGSKGPAVATATGGTNWRKYLPPRFQRIIFFPELWSDEEKENWGKSWVLEQIKE